MALDTPRSLPTGRVITTADPTVDPIADAAVGPDSAAAVVQYYHSLESRIGYQLLLGGTKHFGYYEPDESRWKFAASIRRMERELANYLDLPAGAIILDGGCGKGVVATNLASWQQWQIDGIDLLDFNIAAARKRAKKQGVGNACTFRVANYVDEPLAAEHYDGIYTMETLVHVDRVEAALDHFYQALKPGGRLVLVEYSRMPDSNMPKRAARCMHQINTWGAMPGCERFEHGVLAELVENAGFCDIVEHDLTTRIMPMLKAFAQLAWLPYQVVRLFRAESHAVNAMGAVECYRYLPYWRYNVIVADKPGA